MGEKKVALRYAISFIELSKERKILENIHCDMQLIGSVCKNNRHLITMLRSPIIKQDKKAKILEAIFQNKIHSLTLDIIRFLIFKKRERFIPAITLAFHDLYNDFKQIQAAHVTTPIVLDERLKNDIKEVVKRYSQRELIELTEHVDEELIGGFVLDIGDRRIDTSLRSKIQLLKLLFMKKSHI